MKVRDSVDYRPRYERNPAGQPMIKKKNPVSVVNRDISVVPEIGSDIQSGMGDERRDRKYTYDSKGRKQYHRDSTSEDIDRSV